MEATGGRVLADLECGSMRCSWDYFYIINSEIDGIGIVGQAREDDGPGATAVRQRLPHEYARRSKAGKKHGSRRE
jgi:hypothetical protein